MAIELDAAKEQTGTSYDTVLRAWDITEDCVIPERHVTHPTTRVKLRWGYDIDAGARLPKIQILQFHGDDLVYRSEWIPRDFEILGEQTLHYLLEQRLKEIGHTLGSFVDLLVRLRNTHD